MTEGRIYRRLGDYIKEYSVKNKAGEDIPVYSVTNSQGFCKEYFSKEVASQDKTSYKIVPYGCFAYNPSRINVGSIDWQHKEEKVIVSPLYNVFCVSEGILQSYLLYFLKSPATIKFIDTIATGTVRLNLKLSMLKDFTLHIPSIPIQRAIVSELDKINELLLIKKSQLHDIDVLSLSIFYDMFGDTMENEKRWEMKKLKEIGKILTGNTPSRSVPDYYDSNYIEWIKTDNIIKNQLYATEAKEYLSPKGANCGRIVNEGSLLVACIAGSIDSIGKACVTNRRVAFNQQINAIVPNDSINVLFLYYLVMSIKGTIQKNASTGMKHILTKSVMEDIAVPLPPLALQQSFAARITAIEQEKLQINASIKDLETLLASRMQFWFD